MDEERIKLAIPVLRSRVAPVFNWCSRICIFSAEGNDDPIDGPREIDLGTVSAFSRLKALRELGVRTLICGALSPDLLTYGKQLGLQIVAGVAGEVNEVLEAFGRQELDQPRFWMPGCQGPRRYCHGGVQHGNTRSETRRQTPPTGGEPAICSTSEKTPVKTQTPGLRAGPGGSCTCPQCGRSLQHQRGIPCGQLLCPACHQPMIRT